MTLAQDKGEDARLARVDPLDEIGPQLERLVVADEASIGVGAHVADVARPGDEADDVAAGRAELAVLGREIDHDGRGRDPLGDGREFPLGDALGEERRLSIGLSDHRRREHKGRGDAQPPARARDVAQAQVEEPR